MISQREIDSLGPAPSLDETTRLGWRERLARLQQQATHDLAQAAPVPAEVTSEPEPVVAKRKNKRKFDQGADEEGLRRSKRITGLPPTPPSYLRCLS